VKLEEILPEIRKGRKARRKDFAMVDLDPGDKYLDLDVDDLLADDWELVPELIRVADYLIPLIHPDNKRDYFVKETHPIGQQPEGAVMVPGSERASND
jgi:hypothetical protein